MGDLEALLPILEGVLRSEGSLAAASTPGRHAH